MLVFILCGVVVLTIIDRVALIVLAQAVVNKLRREGYVVAMESDVRSVDIRACKLDCPDIFITGGWWFAFGGRRDAS